MFCEGSRSSLGTPSLRTTVARVWFTHHTPQSIRYYQSIVRATHHNVSNLVVERIARLLFLCREYLLRSYPTVTTLCNVAPVKELACISTSRRFSYPKRIKYSTLPIIARVSRYHLRRCRADVL